MTDLQGLIERLEKAEGPDRELDLAVLCAVPAPSGGWIEVWPDHLTWDSLDEGHRAPPLTASIDAALAFSERVRPDWCGLSLLELAGSGRFTIQARDACDPTCAEGSHAKPAMAILIATLRALMGKEGCDAD